MNKIHAYKQTNKPVKIALNQTEITFWLQRNAVLISGTAELLILLVAQSAQTHALFLLQVLA